MREFTVHPIGHVTQKEEGAFIELDRQFIPGLQALTGFSHIQVLWWFSELDDAPSSAVLEAPQPYKGAPQVMGVFATRSPMRPNPIALSVAQVLDVDLDRGLIRVPYLDAYDGTPVLDIKPYTPSLDRVEAPAVPAWCAHWPMSTEASGDFDWASQFNFPS